MHQPEAGAGCDGVCAAAGSAVGLCVPFLLVSTSRNILFASFCYGLTSAVKSISLFGSEPPGGEKRATKTQPAILGSFKTLLCSGFPFSFLLLLDTCDLKPFSHPVFSCAQMCVFVFVFNVDVYSPHSEVLQLFNVH